MGRSDDPFWKEVEDMNDGSMKCKFCGLLFAKYTSIWRIKWHLSRERGHGVKICERVPKEVQEAAFLALHGVKKRHKSIASSSNVNDNAISTTPQERQNNEDDNLAGDAGRIQAPVTMVQALGTVLEEITNVREDDIENGTGGVVQPGAGASSSGGLTGNTNETPGDTLPTSLHVEVDNNRTQMIDQEKSGWALLMTNLILELASAVFDQLGYALIGMVLAFVALLLATAELVYMARKERMDLLPRFRRSSTGPSAPGKPVGTIVEYFGLLSAVWQCFFSTMEYAYARQKKDHPIKMSLLPFLFLLCVVFSKIKKHSSIDKSA